MNRADHVEFLVEDASTEAALHQLVPKLLPAGISYQVHSFQGKQDLLKKLPQRLRAYARWVPETWRIVVVLDQDQQDCRCLKGRVEHLARQAGLRVRESGIARWQLACRIAVEELEAWFLGDLRAVRSAYPNVPEGLEQKSKFRDPDRITNAWEKLEKLLQKAGYFKTGLRKIEAARTIAAHMDPWRNRSKSFRVFRDILIEMRGGGGPDRSPHAVAAP